MSKTHSGTEKTTIAVMWQSQLNDWGDNCHVKQYDIDVIHIA